MCDCVVWGDGGCARSVRVDLVPALGAPLTGAWLLSLQSGVVLPYDDVISRTYYTTQSVVCKSACHKATANALLMRGLSDNLTFDQSVLANSESLLDDDMPAAGSKWARADDGDGVTVEDVGRVDDCGAVDSLGCICMRASLYFVNSDLIAS